MRIFTMAFFLGVCSLTLVAQAEETTPSPKKLYVIYDSSNSMWGALSDESRKYEAGRKALADLLAGDVADRTIAFRAYGHREKANCRDTELMVPFTDAETAKEKISQAAAEIRPTGKTPISYSLQEALKDFGDEQGDILLVSDGIETCDQDPCELMRQWQKSNVSIRVHVVGVGLEEYQRAAMSCIAEVSGGQYFDADSEDRFAEALRGASTASAQPQSKPDTVDQVQGYAFTITATDDQGRSYVVAGQLLKDGSPIDDVRSHGRNIVEGPGRYEIEVGPLLADGSLYNPVRQTFSIDKPGEISVAVQVERPAIVTASFLEEGDEHPGALVTAYQGDKEVFSFRAFDEVLVRPGTYEFRTDPNKDNALRRTETVVAGEQTELLFELTKTLNFYIVFVLPNGELVQRNSELMRGGEIVYRVHSQNGGLARPGRYQVQSADSILPVPPTDIEILAEGETVRVPLQAGFLQVVYAQSDDSYLGKPDRASLQPVDRDGASKSVRPNEPIAVAPGTYEVSAHKGAGFFDTQRVTIGNAETKDVTFTPKALGQVVVTYVPSDKYKTEPDRAFVEPLDGQELKKGFVRPGMALKLLPGRYKVNGWRAAGDIPPQEFTVTAHETTEVQLSPAP